MTEGAVATGISDRRPVDAGQSFSVSAGKLYCFSAVSGAAADIIVTHVWYREGKEMARVELPVRSADWGTWPSKTLLPEWTGRWQVTILDGEGNLLLAIPFTVI